MATETKQTAHLFARERQFLINAGKHFRLSIQRGLEDIQFKIYETFSKVVAIIQNYLLSAEVYRIVLRCGGILAGQHIPQHAAVRAHCRFI